MIDYDDDDSRHMKKKRILNPLSTLIPQHQYDQTETAPITQLSTSLAKMKIHSGVSRQAFH